MISPSANEELWRRIRFGKAISPGVVKLSGPGLVIGWDIKNASGAFGGSTTRVSEPLKEFEAEFYLSDEEDALGISDFDLWDDFEKVLRSSCDRATPKALDVYHPDLARVNITAAVVKSIGLVALDGKGGGTIKVAFVEYKPIKKISYAQTKTEGDKKIDKVTAEIEVEKKRWERLRQ